MSHPLTIDFPDDVVANLCKIAHDIGKSPEVLALELVSRAVQELEEESVAKVGRGDRIPCDRRSGTT